ncbi:fluoride efflux transporter FluC [Williamsia sterculiae]|uniref:Fluoride-specific ion channel FluC n=1 Tax=Williamsia sterculiae TaxID=1344003 RepID=A0A1N7FWS2_9NOCA|nr:CrcB family protein [Williamsia sterculiae]SIS04813.1 CrcB protein [Williamsia sterculiae]
MTDDIPEPSGAINFGDSHSELPIDPDLPTDTRALHHRPTAIVAVFVGGIVGTTARYFIEALLPAGTGSWPWATFLINLGGAFVLGALLEALTRMGDDSGWRQRTRLCVGTGVCGAFTTYSTLALETSLLGRAGHYAFAIGYAAASVVTGTITAWAGITIATTIHRRWGDS